MRRQTVRALAQVGRLAALAGCCLGLCTWALWTLAPERIAAFESSLLQEPVARTSARLAQADGLADAQRREVALQEIASELAHVRAGDRLAPFAVECRHRLAEAAARRGATEAAIALWQEAVLFDPLDAHAAAKLAELEAATGGAVAAAALERLLALRAMAPTSVPIVAANVRALVRAGKLAAAIDVLAAAAAEPVVSLWQISVAGADGRHGDLASVVAITTTAANAVQPPPDDAVGAVRLCLALAAGVTRLRCVPPERWAADPPPTLRVFDAAGQAVVVGDVTASTSSPGHEFVLPAGFAAVRAELLVGVAAAPAHDLAMLALDPVLVRANRGADSELLAWRGRALAGVRLTLRMAADRLALPSMRAFEAAPSPTTDSTSPIVWSWSLPEPASVLQFALPAQPVLLPIVRVAGQSLVPDLFAATHDVIVHRDGIEVVGDDPWVRLVLAQATSIVAMEMQR